MKIEAIIICINYSDFLRVTLPTNKAFFDKIVIVTDCNDIATHKVCEFYNVQCIKTNEFYKDGSTIANKAIGINIGLKHISKGAWVVQLDADIWLPPMTRDIIENYPLDGKCIYGIDRLMCNSYKEWVDFIHSSEHKPLHEGYIYLHLHHFHIGQRVVEYKGEGYMPIGFFQLWNPSLSEIESYPVEIVGYDRTDVLHLKQFERINRRFIADLICVHLASEEHGMGQNWNGRKTIPFSPVTEKLYEKFLRKISYSINFVKHHVSKIKKKRDKDSY